MRSLFITLLLLFGSFGVRADDASPGEEAVLFTNVVFRQNAFLIDKIILENANTHQEITLTPYKGNFVHKAGTLSTQHDGCVFQQVPVGRYFVRRLHHYEHGVGRSYSGSGMEMPHDVKLQRPDVMINIMPGYINYIGELTVGARQKGGVLTAGVNFQTGLEKFKQFVKNNAGLFSGKKLLINVPGSRPLLVTP